MISLSRRGVAAVAAAAALIGALLLASPPARAWNSDDMTGALPKLAFTLTRATDGKAVTAADYKGKVVLLYFGYTFCPDVCPTTLLNITTMLKKMGKQAEDVRVLFVTVDPDRDTAPILKAYVNAFSPEMDGLRGTANAIAILARRYRVAYAVKKPTRTQPYEVNHSSAVFFFDRKGHARLVTLTTNDTAGVASDIERLIEG